MSERKKRILINTAYIGSKTGFGKHALLLLKELFKTGKYDLYAYMNGVPVDYQEFEAFPWKMIGSLPNNANELSLIQRDRKYAHNYHYGSYYIDKVIAEVQPDIFLGVEDIWGAAHCFDKPWWNKMTCLVHTTLDSLPLLPLAVDSASKIKNYWVWASFAEKEMTRLGHSHVETVHGCVNTESFYPLSEEEKQELRLKHGIDSDCFVIGFVFRNQLRKSVPNLMQGFAKFKEEHPNAKAKLLLHTCFSESPEKSWNIPELAKNNNIDADDILCTYVCQACKKHFVMPFQGESKECPCCHAIVGKSQIPNSLITTRPAFGIRDKELNEIYNLMDVYCHPFTSGGQEIPIQEAKSAGLVTCVTNYACGTDMDEEEACSVMMDYETYYEPGTLFKKATTTESSIARSLSLVFNMSKEERSAKGNKAREWVIKHYSVKSIAKIYEDFFDSCEIVQEPYFFETELKNPDVILDEGLSDEKWCRSLISGVLKETGEELNKTTKFWMDKLNQGFKRTGVEAHIRGLARFENGKMKKRPLESLFDENGRKRILFVVPQSIGDVFIATACFKSIVERYPDHDLYVATKQENVPILHGDPYVYKIIAYDPIMESETEMIGYHDVKGYVDVYFNPLIQCQVRYNYLSNNELGLELNEEESA